MRAGVMLVALVGGLAMIDFLRDFYEPRPGSLSSALVAVVLEVAPFVLVAWTLGACIFEFFRSIRAGRQEASAEA